MRVNGDAIRTAREATPSPTRAGKPLSRAELAVAVGVSVETIGAIERNQHSPGSVTLARISTILQTPIDTFFTSDEEITA